MKKFFLIASVFLLTACSTRQAAFEQKFKSTVPVTDVSVISTDNGQAGTATEKIPASINLNIPFFPQAPDADWSLPWQETCEEASVILAYHYATQKSLTKDEFRQAILDLVEWEKERFGDYQHTDIAQTAQMLQGFYGFADWEIIDDPTVDTLKSHLAEGHAIIAPFAGRELKNPFFRGEGPLYHMLVIRGYDETHFITNDVGTRRGENFIYPYERILSAMHEWHDGDINLGAQKVIVVK